VISPVFSPLFIDYSSIYPPQADLTLGPP